MGQGSLRFARLFRTQPDSAGRCGHSSPNISWVIGFLVLIAGGLTFFFNRTVWGKAMNACADNPNAARLVGINVQRMMLLSFALSAAIGSVAGITMTPIALMTYDRGAMLAIKGFGAAILGGAGQLFRCHRGWPDNRPD